MKKILKVFMVMLSVLMITGCVSESTRNEINEEFIKKGIIDKKWELIDTYTESQYSSEFRTYQGYGFVYKSSDNKMYLLYIKEHTTKVNDKTTIYYVEKYDISHINEHEEIKDECGSVMVKYQDGKCSTKTKYYVDESSKKEYGITRTYKQFLIFRRKTWVIEEGIKDSK